MRLRERVLKAAEKEKTIIIADDNTEKLERIEERLAHFTGNEVDVRTSLPKTSEPSTMILDDNAVERLLDLTDADYNHGIHAIRDSWFRDRLSKQHSEGNLQSQIDKTFAFITTRTSEARGKFDIYNPERREPTIGASQHAAVFIDNRYNPDEHSGHLGKGLQTLQDLSDVNIPIFYQTAHSLDDLSNPEIKRIKQEGAIPLTKNVAPKLYDDERRAQNTVKLHHILQDHPELNIHTVDIHPKGVRGYITSQDKHITFSKKAPREPQLSPLEQQVLDDHDMDTTMTNHQLYVLSQWHTKLQPSKVDTWESASKDFYDWNTIDEAIPTDTDISMWMKRHLKTTYQAIVQKHRDIEPTVLMHGDAKADNWFNDAVLGDYGSSGEGTHYKDLAKTLTIRPPGPRRPNHREISKHSFSPDTVEKRLRRYHDLRNTIDEEYNEPFTQLKQRTYERIITESLRTAMYKGRAGQPSYTESLVNLSFKYMNAIRNDEDLTQL